MNLDKCWRNLASAVINHAISEREQALRSLARNPDKESARMTLEEIDEFLESEWFEVILGMSGIDLDAEEMRRSIYDR